MSKLPKAKVKKGSEILEELELKAKKKDTYGVYDPVEIANPTLLIKLKDVEKLLKDKFVIDKEFVAQLEALKSEINCQCYEEYCSLDAEKGIRVFAFDYVCPLNGLINKVLEAFRVEAEKKLSIPT